MDGIFFYWFGWMGWVITTFLWKKDRNRLFVSALLLMAIFFSNKTIAWYHYKMNVAFLLLGLTTYVLISSFKNRFSILYALLSTISLTGAYNAFRYLEFIDPVWIIFNEKLMHSLFLVWIVLMLSGEFIHRVTLLLAGIIHGEIVFALSVMKFSFVEEIGSLYAFDVLAIGLMIIALWNVVENMNYLVDIGWHKKTKQRQG